jgi:hypothetical protein
MVSQSAILKFGILSSLDSSTLTGTFQILGSPLAFPARIVKITNTSNVGATISVDGVTSIDFVPATSFVLYDCGTNRGNGAPSMDIQEGTQFYAKGSAGTGLIYLTYLYAEYPPITISL